MTAIRQFVEMVFGARDGGAAKALGAIRTGAEAADSAASKLSGKLLQFGATGLILKGAADGLFRYAESLAKGAGESSKLATEFERTAAAGEALKSTFDAAFGKLLEATLPAVTVALREIRNVVDVLMTDLGVLDESPALSRALSSNRNVRFGAVPRENPDDALPFSQPLLTGQLQALVEYNKQLAKTNEEMRTLRRDRMSRQSPDDLFPGLTSAGPVGPEYNPEAQRAAREKARFEQGLEEQQALAGYEQYASGSAFVGAQQAVEKLRGSIMNLGDYGAAAVGLLNDGLGGTADLLVESFRGTTDLGEGLKQLGSDLLAQFAKMLVYQALLKGTTALLGGIGFAHGGVMRGGGRGGDEPLRLSAYANGGIARGPQLALYGETSRPEAYVPLPDGRSIPVTMQAAGGDTFVMHVNAIDARSFEQRLAQHPRVYTSAMRRGLSSNGGDRSVAKRAVR